MIIRSMPPASAHLAEIPVPAPPPMMGLPAASWARRRWRHSSFVKKLMGLLRVLFGRVIEEVNYLASLGALAPRVTCLLAQPWGLTPPGSPGNEKEMDVWLQTV